MSENELGVNGRGTRKGVLKKVRKSRSKSSLPLSKGRGVIGDSDSEDEHENRYSEGKMLTLRQIRCCPCGCLFGKWNTATVLDYPRTFFKLPSFPTPPSFNKSLGNKKKEYAERRLLGYSMEQMYDIVADVDKYREFVPWCTDSKVTFRRAGMCRADMAVGFPPVVERYSCNITLDHPQLVKSVATEGRVFNNLTTTWKFSPGLPDNPKTSTLDYSLHFEFRSVIHAHLAHMFFDEVVNTMVKAFLTRAEKLHGKASIPEHQMKPKIISHKT